MSDIVEKDPIVKNRSKTAKPSMYRVLLLNDDYTTMEFVIEVLQKFFHMEYMDAWAIMMKIHKGGHGLCGVFTREVAETKIVSVMDYAKSEGHPLQCVMEKDE